MNNLQITLTVETPSIRLDLALLDALQKREIEVSRSTLKTWFRDKKILLQGRPASASHLLNSGVYSVTLVECEVAPPAAQPAPPGFTLPIVYEDEDFFVLHKRSGIPSLPHLTSESETAVNFALAHAPQLASFGRTPLEPGLIHRLDTGTSGLLVFAKTEKEFQRLNTAWKKREIRKFYRALVEPAEPLKPMPFRIEFPLAHDAKSSKKMIAIQDSSPQKLKRLNIRGKPLDAITQILRNHSTPQSTPHSTQKLATQKLADLEIEIETGVMHQIRCHLSSLGWPILGDSLYRGSPSERLWLHAWRLEIPLSTGKTLRLEAALPAGWI